MRLRQRISHYCQHHQDGLIVAIYFLILLFVTSAAPELRENIAFAQEILLLIFLIGLLFSLRRSLFRPMPLEYVCKAVLWGILALFLEFIVIAIGFLVTKMTVPSNNTARVIALIKQNYFYFGYSIVIAPLVEELVFHQSFFNLVHRMLNKFAGKHKYVLVKRDHIIIWFTSAFVTAVIFAGLHADNEVWEYILISFFLQWLYYHYQDIRVCQITHISFNLGTLALLFFA